MLYPTAEVYVESSALEAEYVAESGLPGPMTVLLTGVLSIVAVHGLGGNARSTWTEPDSGKFWLEDLLPDAFPKARVITFGYDSGLAFSRSKAGIENSARDLLNRLRILRSSYEVTSYSRPWALKL